MKTSATIWFKRAVAALAFVLPVSASAQSIYIYPAAVTAPRGSYQTVTAVVNGVNDKTVTWTSSGGTLVGTNPCAVNEPCTIALTTTTPGTYTVTATSDANHAVTATSTITITASPTPVSGHPRLLVTSSMLAGLRAKATGSNALFVALKTNATNQFAVDNSRWSWTCNGGTGLPSSDQTGNFSTEQDANLYAFLALVDPSDSTYNWGCYAHDMWVYQTVHIVAESAPISSDRIRYSGKALAYTTDWLMGSGLLNSTEQAESATFLHYLGKQVFSNVQGVLPPITGYNSSAQFNTGSDTELIGQYAMGNNYLEGKFLIGAALGITFNDSTGEDPTLTNCAGGRYAVCPDYSANSLRAYWNYWAGAYLYKQYAHLEDPNVGWAAYQAAYANLPTQPMCKTTYSGMPMVPCFGTGRGGGPAEGNGYGYSVYSVRNAMNIIHTAGMDDPLLYGPQMSLVTSSWWELNENMELTYLAGLYGAAPQHWAYFSTGDTNSYYRYPFFYVQLASDLVFNSYFGRSRPDLLWPILNTAQNGPSNFTTYDLVNSYGQFLSLDLFIALPAGNPTANPPADPRPSLPLDTYDPGQQDIFARTGWAASDTTFTADCNPSLTSHDHMYCGRFEVFSKGEYITKGQVVFDDDYNYAMADSTNSNLPSYLNNASSTQCTFAIGCYFWPAAQFGGQFFQAGQAGPVTMNHSELPGHVAFNADLTNAYNGTSDSSHVSSYNGVDSASRSLVYLRGTNQVVYYDRGSTAGNTWDKALYTITTGPPTISGNTVTWPTRSSTQKAYLTSLLPSGANIADIGLDQTNRGSAQPQDWEPYTRIKIDAGNTPATHFLTVLEWGASSSTKSSTSLVVSSSGQNFDGSLIGSSLVMFMRTWPATFTGVTYPASGATTHYISDLSPNTTYTISGTGTPASATTDNAGILTFAAAGTGSITISAGSSSTPNIQGITVTPSTVILQTLASQQYAANCTYSDGSTADCTSAVTWASSAMGVVTVNTSGMATGVAQGTANIVASSNGIQGQASVSVPAATLQKISVTPGSTTVPIGGTQQFKATGIYSDSSTTDMTTAVSWSSSNNTVATPTSTGLTAAMSQGSANIIAASGTIKGQAAVTVTAAATPTFSPAAGTYSSAQTVTISTTTPSATIYYTTNGSTPTTSSAVYSGPIAVASTETVQAVAVASGNSTSTIGSATYTINLPQAATPAFSPTPGTYNSAQTVTIGTTTPSATIHFTIDGSTPTTSSPVYSGPITVAASETVSAVAVAGGYSTSAAGSAAYTISMPKAATPSFSPAAGTYASAQTVTISTTTPSATIYFTTDGSRPTTSSQVYSGPITVAATETIKALAVVSGGSNSTVGSAAYTINLSAVAIPTFSPAAGTYTSAQTVTISTTTPSTTIYYTTNGSTPTTSSPVYSGPIPVTATETIQAIAVANNNSTNKSSNSKKTIATSSSAVSSAAYTIDLTAPTFTVALSPAALTVTSGRSGTTTAFVIPQNGFASAVSFRCSGLPAGAVCKFAPATLTPSGALASTTLTVTAPTASAALPRNSNASFPGSALALVLCCFGRKRRRGLHLASAGIAAGLGLGLCIGCGVEAVSTPSTTSTISVIAANGSLQPATSLTLTVQ